MNAQQLAAQVISTRKLSRNRVWSGALEFASLVEAMGEAFGSADPGVTGREYVEDALAEPTAILAEVIDASFTADEIERIPVRAAEIRRGYNAHPLVPWEAVPEYGRVR